MPWAGAIHPICFDLNDYSVPHTHVRRTLTVLADIHELRVVDGAQVLALHSRSYDRGAQVEETEHLQALIDQKQAARQHRATNRLAQVAPASQDLLVRAAERGAKRAMRRCSRMPWKLTMS